MGSPREKLKDDLLIFPRIRPVGLPMLRSLDDKDFLLRRAGNAVESLCDLRRHALIGSSGHKKNGARPDITNGLAHIKITHSKSQLVTGKKKYEIHDWKTRESQKETGMMHDGIFK